MRQHVDLVEMCLGIAREIMLQTSFDDVVPLTTTEVAVARHVAAQPGVSPSDVADGLGLQRSNVSAAVKSLEGHGLLTRGKVGRAVRLQLTDEGTQELAIFREEWSRVLDSILLPSADHLSTTVQTLSAVERALVARRLAPARDADPAGRAGVRA